MRFSKAGIEPNEIEAFKACGVEGKSFIDIDGNSECYRQIVGDRLARRAAKPDGVKGSAQWAVAQGAEMWAELHRASNANRDWFDKFTRRIPCGDCKRHWLGLLQTNPPEYGARWFAWTIKIHNLVNKQLNKDQMSKAEACRVWGRAA